jgi:hypothetical protein
LPDNQYFDLQATAENSKGETIQWPGRLMQR